MPRRVRAVTNLDSQRRLASLRTREVVARISYPVIVAAVALAYVLVFRG